MIIKLTNANEVCKGEAIYINANLIVSFRRGRKKIDDPSSPQCTFVFIPPHGTWEVEELPEEIVKLIKKKL